MLTRISVVVKKENLAFELREALSGMDASVQIHPLQGNFWELAGADGVLNTTLDEDVFVDALRSIIERAREEMEQRIQAELDRDKASIDDFASRSPIMQRFMNVVSRVSNADSSLLILGETGVLSGGVPPIVGASR